MLMYMDRHKRLTSACNALEYENYGEAIPECNILRKKPLDKDALRALSEIALRPHHAHCEQGERFVNIPATLYGSTDEGVINLKNLYENGVATLNISTASYAKKHNWIAESAHADTKVFVSKFMLILPPGSQNGNERVDEISLEHTGGISYIVFPGFGSSKLECCLWLA